MLKILNFLYKIITKPAIHIQLLFTVFTFFLMVILSYNFVTRIVRNNLVRNTESVLDFVEAQIESDLLEPQAILGGFGQTIRDMLLNGEDVAKMNDYTNSILYFLQTRDKIGLGINKLYAYIERLPGGPVFFNGINIIPPGGFSPTDHLWYNLARERGGDIVETSPYKDGLTDEIIMTYSYSLYDDEKNYLGVACIDVRIDYIGKKVVNTSLTKGGYGFLAAHDLTLLAHPNPNYERIKFSNPMIPLSTLVDELEKNGMISEAPLVNWKGEKCIAFIRPLHNGWYLGLLAVKNLYYKDVRNMALILSLLSAVMIIILIRIESARSKSDRESRHKSAFLANMSHEIRTPMNAIIGMLTIGKSASDVERKDYCFGKIEDASNHLLGVINDILDMSKIEANKFELSPIEFDFEKMLQRVVNVVNFRIDEKHQKFSVHIDHAIPRILIGDDQRLAQILTNLLGNAVKFTPEKGSISLTTHLINEENGICNIEISVSDSGIGISNEQKAKLFKSFEQAESNTTRKYGGTGLGLAISKNIVELMGGEIGVQSELGKGSTFYFSVKLQRGKQEKVGLLDSNVDLENVRILIVDDDPTVLAYFREITQRLKVFCDTAEGGKEALELIKKNGAYHIYFIDWRMPGMDGMQLARELKERIQENSVVIMITAAELGVIMDDAKKAGVDKFLSKPLFPSAVAEIINMCLTVDRRQSQSAKESIDGIFEGRRILLVEDVEINREIVKSLLEPTKLMIDCAENGLEAVRKFAEAPEKYNMIFMDLQMPEMDGYDATQCIRKLVFPQAKTIPIVAMTANVFREDVERCLKAGMNDHVGKPIDFKEVLEKLNKYLN
jgi:two-component system, sensor histidine kinase and response regulator